MVRKERSILLLLLSALPLCVLGADTGEDLRFLSGLVKEGDPAPATRTPREGETNEAALLLKAVLGIYRIFISSQDKPSCGFTPSCSAFSKEAIGTYGILRGIVMTADRLQRCHGMGAGYYPVDPDSGKFIDPPERNLLGR